MGRPVAPSNLDGKLGGKPGIGRIQGRQVKFGVDDFKVAEDLKVGGRHPAFPLGLKEQPAGTLRKGPEPDLLHVQQKLHHVFFDMGDRRKLMLNLVDPHRRHRRPRQGTEQNPAQGVPQGDAVAALEGLGGKLPVIALDLDDPNLRLSNFDLQVHPLPFRAAKRPA